MKNIFLGISLLSLFAFVSCTKKADNTNISPAPTAPSKLYFDALFLNNVDVSTVPAGMTVEHFYVKVYGSNVLLETFDFFLPNLRTGSSPVGGSPDFSYSNFQEFDLKYSAMASGGTIYDLGTVHLRLKDYPSATYPSHQRCFIIPVALRGRLNALMRTNTERG